MGADILQDGRVAIIKGQKLSGAHIRAMDLRGGAALTVAALGARGESELSGIHFIERGYVNLDLMLRELGADIVKTD
jgi:UDP-N-acetylglucosamine 1-carboxyvinyltransferase